MLKRSLLLCGLAIMALMVSSCLFDPDEDKKPPTDEEQITRQDLTQKWHVLNNIEYAYKTRRADIYDELLSNNFVFYFSEGDVNGGSPATFDRTEENSATGRLFQSNEQTQNPPPDPVCRSMRLDLVYDKANLNWVEVIPEDFPDETWYATTVFYTFTFEIEPNTTYIAQNGAKAQFTIRNTGTEQAPHWELVEFRDLGS